MVLASREASETFIAHEIETLKQRGFPLVVASLDDLPRTKRSADIPVRHFLHQRMMEELLAFSPRNALRIWRHRHHISALAKLARETHATRLHAQFAWLAADIAGIVAATLKIPWSCSVHAWDVFTRPVPELRRRLRGADFVIACNQRARDAVARAVTCHAHLVRHGVRIVNPVATAREPLRVCAIGRLVPKKGFDTLLVAMSRLCHNEARCVLVGDGPARGTLQRLATRLGISERVTFAGRLSHDDAMRELARSTLLALPSRVTRDGDRDGFANVLTEAMSHGVPIVTTTAAGADELLANDESALLVPPDDAPSLARAIDRLLAAPALQKSLAENARRVLETFLSEEVEIGKTENLLRG